MFINRNNCSQWEESIVGKTPWWFSIVPNKQPRLQVPQDHTLVAPSGTGVQSLLSDKVQDSLNLCWVWKSPLKAPVQALGEKWTLTLRVAKFEFHVRHWLEEIKELLHAPSRATCWNSSWRMWPADCVSACPMVVTFSSDAPALLLNGDWHYVL